MDRYALFALLALITLPWWRAVLEGVVRDVWSAGEPRETDFSSSPRRSSRSSGGRRQVALRTSRRSAGLEVPRSARTRRERHAQRQRWEAGFGRRGL